MGGGRKETVTDMEILSLFLDTDDPVLFTNEVANNIGLSSQGTLPRLRKLETNDLVNSKKHGRTIVWWITDDGKMYCNLDG